MVDLEKNYVEDLFQVRVQLFHFGGINLFLESDLDVDRDEDCEQSK